MLTYKIQCFETLYQCDHNYALTFWYATEKKQGIYDSITLLHLVVYYFHYLLVCFDNQELLANKGGHEWNQIK